MKKPGNPAEKVAKEKQEEEQKPLKDPEPKQAADGGIKAATESDSLKNDCEMLQQQIDSLLKEIDELKKKIKTQEGK